VIGICLSADRMYGGSKLLLVRYDLVDRFDAELDYKLNYLVLLMKNLAAK
jgi:hypothetical protein